MSAPADAQARHDTAVASNHRTRTVLAALRCLLTTEAQATQDDADARAALWRMRGHPRKAEGE